MEEVELPVAGPAGHTLQGTDHTQLVQLAGQGRDRGQEVLLGEPYRVRDCTVILQCYRTEVEEFIIFSQNSNRYLLETL